MAGEPLTEALRCVQHIGALLQPDDQLAVRRITLITGHDERAPLAEMAEKLDDLKQSLIEVDVELDVKLNPNIHDRQIRIDNG